ncbi:hypothetical protein P9D43_29055 [Neobacillus niacini]|uniref:hypothetical protein n=1 Tax=Neobacillus niacini TaxID=86668 RepID=UPI0007ABA29D|nr:hypothetical protein [Neobacillus niacini]MEC1526048.1 hypothetical protein [Neobacillus niacini]
MDETKSEQEIRKYIKENIDKYDLAYYNIEIFKKDIQELEKENNKHLLSRYLKPVLFQFMGAMIQEGLGTFFVELLIEQTMQVTSISTIF